MARELKTEKRTVTFSQKWGDDPFTSLGYTQVPNALIEYAARLNLKSEECWLICCVLRFKYDASNPCPQQEDLARLFGQSIDTVQRTVKKITDKSLLKVTRMRDQEGRFTHTVYDFTHLRQALNECYYHDHPGERPVLRIQQPTPQNCGLVNYQPQTAEMRSGNEHKPVRKSAVRSTPQNSGLFLKEDLTTEKRADNPAAPSSTETLSPAPPADIAAALISQLNGVGLNLADAQRLAKQNPDECRRQLEFLPYVGKFTSSKGAWLRAAIEGAFAPPTAYVQRERKPSAVPKAAIPEAIDITRSLELQQFAEQIATYRQSLSGEEETSISQLSVETLKRDFPFLAARIGSKASQSKLEDIQHHLIAQAAGIKLPAFIAM